MLTPIVEPRSHGRRPVDDRRTVSRTLMLVLAAALDQDRCLPPNEGPVRFRAGGHAPMPASAGDLTPYAVEILADEVRAAAGGVRVDLYVGTDSAAPFCACFHSELDRLHDYGVVIHIHD